MLHLCLRKINEKLVARVTRQEPFFSFSMLALQAADSIQFVASTEPGSQ